VKFGMEADHEHVYTFHIKHLLYVKVINTAVVWIFGAFCGAQRLITMFIRAHHRSLSW